MSPASSSVTLALFAVGAAVVATAGAAAAQAQERVRVTVTSASGRSVYLDRGRTAGLVAGTSVRLFPPGAAVLEVTVRQVSSNSARADLDVGLPLPPVGTLGEALVTPPPAAGPAEPAPTDPTAPEHPPWQREVETRDPDQPLLVPTYGQRPEQRPMLLSGRLYSTLDWSRDRGADRGADYTLARLGARVEATNPFGQGGLLMFDGEFGHRSYETDVDADEATEGRVEELSYLWGEEDYKRLGFQLGRFHSRAVPELGLIDGVESQLRIGDRVRVGVGVGAYPLPFPSRVSGEDVGVHLFALYEGDDPGSLSARLALQQTWHEGHPDRNLLVASAQGRLFERLWLFGTTKIDFYGGGDVRKDDPVEVTEFTGQARYDADVAGAGTTITHFRWPDLERRDFADLPDDLVRDGRVDRWSIDGWWRPTTDLRLSGRFGLWRDQDTDGSAWEVAADWDRAFRSAAQLHVALFRADGSYNSGPGFRARLRSPLGDDVHAHVGYGWHRYDVESLLAGTETYTRQSIQAGVDWAVGAFDLDLETEVRFGDREDVWSLSLFAQYRF